MTRFYAAGHARLLTLFLLVVVAAVGGAYAEEAPPTPNPPTGEAAKPPEAQPAKDAKPAEGQTPPAADGKEPTPGTKPAPIPAGEGDQAAPGAKPAGEEAAPVPPKPERKPGPPLAVTAIGGLEILPRDYEATARFYIEVLGFTEDDASGAEGERRCTLVSGPVRITLKEQPGKPILPKRPPWLGVHPAALSEVTAEAAGMKEAKGVLVEDLVPQGPAGGAGIVKGDIILAVEGKETTSPNQLTTTIRGFAAGKKVLVTLWREGKKRDVPVQLPESPFPEQLGPVAVRLQVRDLDTYYRELLRRDIRVYAEPRDLPEGGRVLEMVDPNDLLVVLEEPRPAPEKPAQPAEPAGEKGKEQTPPAPAPAPAPEQPAK